MSHVLETWSFLVVSWIVAVFSVSQATAEVRFLCPSVGRDWYPGIKPQNSAAPYVINVTEQDGRSLHEDYFNGPVYYSSQMTYTSKTPLDAQIETKGTQPPHPYSPTPGLFQSSRAAIEKSEMTSSKAYYNRTSYRC